MTEVKIAGFSYAVFRTLVEAKPGGVPNGHLYAALISEIDLDDWLKLVGLWKTSGRIAKIARTTEKE